MPEGVMFAYGITTPEQEARFEDWVRDQREPHWCAQHPENRCDGLLGEWTDGKGNYFDSWHCYDLWTRLAKGEGQ